MSSTGRSKLFFEEASLLWLGIIFFLIAGIVNQRSLMPILELPKQETAINVNKDLIVFLSAGNKRLLTDLIWVQTLLESDLEHYGKRDLNSWMYIRFSTIATLDPLFYENYFWGGQFLSIVKDDLIGSAKLMERGLKSFPDDYQLNYNLGFTYYYELGDYRKGLGYLEKVQNHPKAPTFIPSLVMKMKAEMGFDFDGILALIYELQTTTKDASLRDKLTKDYHALKAERDIICLNSKKENCSKVDAYGQEYIFAFGKFHTRTPFIPYRLKKKGDYTSAKTVTTIETAE